MINRATKTLKNVVTIINSYCMMLYISKNFSRQFINRILYQHTLILCYFISLFFQLIVFSHRFPFEKYMEERQQNILTKSYLADFIKNFNRRVKSEQKTNGTKHIIEICAVGVICYCLI